MEAVLILTCIAGVSFCLSGFFGTIAETTHEYFEGFVYEYVEQITYPGLDGFQSTPLYRLKSKGPIFRREKTTRDWEIKRGKEWERASFSHGLELEVYSFHRDRNLLLYFNEKTPQ